jgi:hypothetical protein
MRSRSAAAIQHGSRTDVFANRYEELPGFVVPVRTGDRLGGSAWWQIANQFRHILQFSRNRS